MKGGIGMSCMKRWYEENIPKLSDKELLDLGYSTETIMELREIFDPNKYKPKDV